MKIAYRILLLLPIVTAYYIKPMQRAAERVQAAPPIPVSKDHNNPTSSIRSRSADVYMQAAEVQETQAQVQERYRRQAVDDQNATLQAAVERLTKQLEDAKKKSESLHQVQPLDSSQFTWWNIIRPCVPLAVILTGLYSTYAFGYYRGQSHAELAKAKQALPPSSSEK